MGAIYRFDLNQYKTDIFVETGTGMGESLRHALKFDYKKLYTIEIIESLWNQCKANFNDDRCEFINANSKDGLRQILSKTPKNETILFWLDAHFPGADFNLADYSSVTDKDLRIPLESELRLIKELRDTTNDSFIIDDLRIYEDGPFEAGNWGGRAALGGDGIQFIYELFDETHHIQKDYKEQGYIILTPKSNG
jgi:hypothetical protein